MEREEFLQLFIGLVFVTINQVIILHYTIMILGDIDMSFEKVQARIDNIRNAEEANKKYFRRIRVRDYLAGQAIYNLGDYPAKISAAPTDYDRALVKRLAEMGVQLIQVHEDWNDAVRLYGADKFNAVDRQGMKDFVDLCHSYGIKVIAYASSGYFQETDLDFKEEFTTTCIRLSMNYFKYRKCHLGSAAWREYVIPRTLEVMDYYGFDGIFNDCGYDGYRIDEEGVATLPEYDAVMEDMLSTIYAEVKKRGGIYKVHFGANNCPPSKDKVYDYLWIGECVESSQAGIGKDYEQYVVPCQDRRRSDAETLEVYLARTIPFLQFPLLKTGRPIQGKNVDLPNVTYYGGIEQEFYKAIGEYMEEHPEGPYVYSLWSSIPDDVTEWDVWEKYFKLYQPMVTENSLAYIELRECEEILSELKTDVYASMFVNEETYLVVSNQGKGAYELKLKEKWEDRVTGEVSDTFVIDSGKMCFYRKK